MPPENIVDRFRDKEDEETPLSILPSGSRGVTVNEDDIATFHCEGIVVDNDNDTALDNVLHSEDVLPVPKTLNVGFQGINPWRHSGKFPVGKAKLKTARHQPLAP